MKLKQLGLLSLSVLIVHSGSALSVDDVLSQIKSYLPTSEDLHEKPVHPDEPIAHSSGKKPPVVPKYFPCCVCGGCRCSPTTCPQFRTFPSPPEVKWANCSSYNCPPKVAQAGCSAKHSPDACLSFVQQYLQALEPALEFASNHSHESVSASGEKEEDKKKLLCCGETCTDSQCLGYLAMAVKSLQAPINGTLDSEDYNKAPVSEEGEEDRSEL